VRAGRSRGRPGSLDPAGAFRRHGRHWRPGVSAPAIDTGKLVALESAEVDPTRRMVARRFTRSDGPADDGPVATRQRVALPDRRPASS